MANKRRKHHHHDRVSQVHFDLTVEGFAVHYNPGDIVDPEHLPLIDNESVWEDHGLVPEAVDEEEEDFEPLVREDDDIVDDLDSLNLHDLIEYANARGIILTSSKKADVLAQLRES